MSFVAAQMLLNQVSVHSSSGAYGNDDGFLYRWFTPDRKDTYYRSRYEQARDKFFGVETYQLEQRYGRIKHEVIPKEPHVNDWVDNFEMWLDNVFIPHLNGRIMIIPQKTVV